MLKLEITKNAETVGKAISSVGKATSSAVESILRAIGNK